MNNIRIYNNLLAFGSFGAKLVTFHTAGPQVFRICGQTYHNSYLLNPENEKLCKYGQLYVIDNELANNIRLQNKNSKNCSLNLLKELDNVIRTIKSYSMAYKMMHEIEMEEHKKAEKCGSLPKEVKMYTVRNNTLDKKNNGAVACNEVAIVYVGDDSLSQSERDICIYSKTSDACRIPIISQHIDPMIYPLLFPHGECGWHPDLTCSDKNGKQHKLTILQYCSYKLSVREIFNPCLSARKLTQQFIVDAWTKIESCRLYYIRNEQDSLRTDMYKGLMDYVHNQAANSNTVIGKMVILPSSFRGSPCAIQQYFLDSMTICQNFGKPDLF